MEILILHCELLTRAFIERRLHLLIARKRPKFNTLYSLLYIDEHVPTANTLNIIAIELLETYCDELNKLYINSS